MGGAYVAYDDLLLAGDTRGDFDALYIKPLRRQPPSAQAGMLLTGPPGTGKTVLAKAIAVAAGATFLPIASKDVLSQWQGKADRTMDAVIQVALSNAPCIVFFDECEKLLKKSGASAPGQEEGFANAFKAAVAPEVLTKGGVVIICATNHLDQVDGAVVDRLGKANVVELPPLSLEQIATLVGRELPQDHALTPEDITGLADRLRGDGLRSIKEVMRMAANFAILAGDHLAKDHVDLSLKRLEKSKAVLERAHAAASQGPAVPPGVRLG